MVHHVFMFSRFDPCQKITAPKVDRLPKNPGFWITNSTHCCSAKKQRSALYCHLLESPWSLLCSGTNNVYKHKHCLQRVQQAQSECPNKLSTPAIQHFLLKKIYTDLPKCACRIRSKLHTLICTSLYPRETCLTRTSKFHRWHHQNFIGFIGPRLQKSPNFSFLPNHFFTQLFEIVSVFRLFFSQTVTSKLLPDNTGRQ